MLESYEQPVCRLFIQASVSCVSLSPGVESLVSALSGDRRLSLSRERLTKREWIEEWNDEEKEQSHSTHHRSIALGIGCLQFHKDNLRHLSRFPDFFVTFRILSFYSGFNTNENRPRQPAACPKVYSKVLRLSRSLSRFETQDIKTQPMNQPLFFSFFLRLIHCGLVLTFPFFLLD